MEIWAAKMLVYGWENVGLWLRIWIHSWCELDFLADFMIFMAWHGILIYFDTLKVGKWWGYHIRYAKQMWLRQQTVGDLWSLLGWFTTSMSHDLMVDLQWNYHISWFDPTQVGNKPHGFSAGVAGYRPTTFWRKIREENPLQPLRGSEWPGSISISNYGI